MQPQRYPSLFQRYFATALDVFFLIILLVLGVQLMECFVVPTNSPLRHLVILPIVLYEPVLTSKTVTLGQWLFKFRIRDVIYGQKISLVQAYGRWLVKFVLGGISLLTIPNDAQRRAIHDKLMASLAAVVR